MSENPKYTIGNGNMVVDIISKLRQSSDTLSTRERAVASFVQANLNLVSSMTVSEMAAACNVSTPTVIRFCRSMGCNGFREFKIRLAQNLAVSLQYIDLNPDQLEKSDADNIDQILGAMSATVNVMRGQIDQTKLADARHYIVNAGAVLVAGVGGASSMLAIETENRLFRLGIQVNAVSDSYLLQMRAATLTDADVMLLISASGEAEELISAAEIANEYGAQTIAITKQASRLAQLSRTALELDLPEDPDVYKPTASRYAYLVIIDALAMSIAQSRSEETAEKLRRIRASLTTYHNRTALQPLGD